MWKFSIINKKVPLRNRKRRTARGVPCPGIFQFCPGPVWGGGTSSPVWGTPPHPGPRLGGTPYPPNPELPRTGPVTEPGDITPPANRQTPVKHYLPISFGCGRLMKVFCFSITNVLAKNKPPSIDSGMQPTFCWFVEFAKRWKVRWEFYM